VERSGTPKRSEALQSLTRLCGSIERGKGGARPTKELGVRKLEFLSPSKKIKTKPTRNAGLSYF
jgi:hypothetical protein